MWRKKRKDAMLLQGAELRAIKLALQSLHQRPRSFTVSQRQCSLSLAVGSSHDDWLHRGYLLQDMDFHSYVVFVELVLRPSRLSGWRFLFDTHCAGFI